MISTWKWNGSPKANCAPQKVKFQFQPPVGPLPLPLRPHLSSYHHHRHCKPHHPSGWLNAIPHYQHGNRHDYLGFEIRESGKETLQKASNSFVQPLTMVRLSKWQQHGQGRAEIALFDTYTHLQPLCRTNSTINESIPNLLSACATCGSRPRLGEAR